MKHGIGRLLALGAAFVFCFTACGTGGTADEDTQTVLVNYAPSDFTGIKVKNGALSFTLKKSGDTYICRELSDPGVPLSAEAEEDLAALSSGLSARRLSAASPEACGIDGLHTVTLSFGDKGETVLLLGSPIEGEAGCYFSVEGKNGVYAGTSDAFKYYLCGAAGLAGLSLTAFRYPVGAQPVVDAITLENAGGLFAMKKLATPAADGYGNIYAYTLAGEDGEDGYLAQDAYDSYFSAAGAARANSVYALSPDDATLESCGLKTPAARLTLAYGGETEVLLVGMRQGDAFFVKRDGVDAVYLVSSRYADFAGITRQALESRFLCAPPREEVASITVMTPGSGDFYIIDVFDAYGAVDGAHLDEGTFGGLYRLLCSLQGEYPLTGAQDAAAGSLTITFGLTDGTAKTVKLVPYDQKRMSVFIDGRFTGWGVRTAFMEKVLLTLGQITNGQLVEPTW